jgi:hypothetical protein
VFKLGDKVRLNLKGKRFYCHHAQSQKPQNKSRLLFEDNQLVWYNGATISRIVIGNIEIYSHISGARMWTIPDHIELVQQ